MIRFNVAEVRKSTGNKKKKKEKGKKKIEAA